VGVEKGALWVGGGGQADFWRFRLEMESRERDLSSVKELIGPLCGNGFDEDAVGGAGDEVADVFG